MVNLLHIPAEDGSLIQINAAELNTEAGKEYLEREIERRTVKQRTEIKLITDGDIDEIAEALGEADLDR